jgi:hypothetical protein
MSSLSLATAKHLRNVVPYTIIPFDKQGIQGNEEKFKDTAYASVLVPSIIAHTDQKKSENTYDAMANSRKFLKNMAQQIYEDPMKKGSYEYWQ